MLDMLLLLLHSEDSTVNDPRLILSSFPRERLPALRFGAAISALFGWLEPILVILAIGGTVTVGQRLLYAWREMARLDALDRPEAHGTAARSNEE